MAAKTLLSVTWAMPVLYVSTWIECCTVIGPIILFGGLQDGTHSLQSLEHEHLSSLYRDQWATKHRCSRLHIPHQPLVPWPINCVFIQVAASWSLKSDYTLTRLARTHDLGSVSERVAINRKFYTICHWATIDIHRTINCNPLWNGAQVSK